MAMRNKKGQPVVHSSRTLHRYVITNTLGSGGFGEVFRARLIDLDLPVALKRFRKRSGSTQQAVDNWIAECTTHEALSHPNILQSYDAFEDEGFLYLATELATKSLDKYIDDFSAIFPPWNDITIARAGMHLASALHYLHVGWREDTPLVHRDVTPNNVFVFQETDTFKLGDFGISKLLEQQDDIAVTQIANWSFVAPELIRAGYTVPQSDLFQLGLVLYTMAAGDYAIPKSQSIQAQRSAIASGAAWKAANELEGNDEELKDCIKRLLLRDLEKRYPTAEAVHGDLRKIHYRLRMAQ